MAAVDDVDELIEQYHLALGEFLKGNPEPVKKLLSHREDVTLANPYGPPVSRLLKMGLAVIVRSSTVRVDRVT